MNLVYDSMYEFCQNFYTQIIQEQTVENAFVIAKNSMRDFV